MVVDGWSMDYTVQRSFYCSLRPSVRARRGLGDCTAREVRRFEAETPPEIYISGQKGGWKSDVRERALFHKWERTEVLDYKRGAMYNSVYRRTTRDVQCTRYIKTTNKQHKDVRKGDRSIKRGHSWRKFYYLTTTREMIPATMSESWISWLKMYMWSNICTIFRF